MGDMNAVDVVQAIHVDLLETSDLICEGGLMKYKHAIVDKGVLQGVYIDDLIVCLVAKFAAMEKGPHPDRDLIERTHTAYLKAGIERAPEKAFGWGNNKP
eukprot:1485548-Heterocapsa_arctica.AAC.1